MCPTGLPQPEERHQEEVWPGLWPTRPREKGKIFPKGHGMTMKHMGNFTYSTKESMGANRFVLL